MKEARTIHALRQEFAAIKSTVAGDTRFIATALMFLAEHAERRDRTAERILGALDRRIAALEIQRRRHGHPTPYQRFFGRGIKAGKTPRQIADEWQARKMATKS